MKDFHTHSRNARAALQARQGKARKDDLTPQQATMYAHLTVAELEELAFAARPQVIG